MTYPAQAKYILIGKGSTWGTGVTEDKDIGIVTAVNDEPSREVAQSSGASNIEPQQITSHSEMAQITGTCEFQHGRLLEYAIGSVAHDNSDTPDIKHTFTISDDPPFMSVESGNNLTTDSVLAYASMLVESLEITVGLNQVCTMDFVLKGTIPTTSSTASSAVVDTLTVFSQSQQHVNINSSEASQIQEFKIKIVKKVEIVHGTGAVSSVVGRAVDLKFEFEGTLGFSDKTFHDLMVGSQGGYEVEINCHNDTAAGSGRRELKITLENCSMQTFREVMSVENLTFVEMSGHGTLKECFTYDDITSVNW